MTTESQTRILRYFEYGHLPGELQPVSEPFWHMARELLRLPPVEQRAVAFQRLLEAKDAAVRAALDRPELDDDAKCERCGGGGRDGPCPYQQEINDDDTPCARRCCDACRRECVDEI